MSLNPRNIRVAVMTLFVCLTGCLSGNKAATDVTSAPVVLPGVGDYPALPPADFNVDLTLVNESIDERLMALQEPPQVTFTVWGYDELAADVSATNIKVSEFELRPQAVPYYLRFTETELQTIEYQSGTSDTLRYYITMGVDVDGDGKICNGDLRQDYALAPPERFPVAQREVARELIMTEISGEICTE